MTHCLRPLLLLAMLYQFTPGPPAAAKTVKEIVTPTGVLVVDAVNSQAFAHEFKVTLAGQTVLHTIEGDAATPFPNFPEPAVIRYVAEPIGPYDAVVIFQQFSSGNACNGGPIWFLGISKDGRFAISPPIDFCGGRSPRIMIDRGVIHVEFPVDEKDLPSTDARRSQSEEWTFSEKGLARIR
jgi:hypothetical protein